MKYLLLICLTAIPFLSNAQQTFQQFRFDLDPNMPAEDPETLSQLESGPRQARRDAKKPKKIQVPLKRDTPRQQNNALPLTEFVHPNLPNTPTPTHPGVLPAQQGVAQIQSQFPQQFLPAAPQQQGLPAFGQQGFGQQQNGFLPPAYNQQQQFGFGSQLAANQQYYQQNQFAPQPYLQTTTPIAANPAKTPIPYLPELIPRQPVRINPAPADLDVTNTLQIVPTASAAQAVRNVMREKGSEVTATAIQVPDEIVTPIRETLTSASMWFEEEFDTSKCQLTTIGKKFQNKFPSSVASRTKDAKLATLVEARLVECQKKFDAGHWDKVDKLLGKMVALSKSEEADCRSGLVQEQISCRNLLSMACQFVQPTFEFRLVPARMVIQEARHAENGSEKCRNAVRTVKQRLGQKH
ncbi:unnamed protein product, partial [Mesorhabditis spiculigera]